MRLIECEDYIPKDIMEEKKNKIIEKINELLDRTDYYDGYTDTKEVNGVLQETLEIFLHD